MKFVIFDSHSLPYLHIYIYYIFVQMYKSYKLSVFSNVIQNVTVENSAIYFVCFYVK